MTRLFNVENNGNNKKFVKVLVLGRRALDMVVEEINVSWNVSEYVEIVGKMLGTLYH